jgi:diguanylate cyclase (GGDEF)-like protein
VVFRDFLATLPDPGVARTDQRLLARIAGILYLCGSLLVALVIALPHPASVDEQGLALIIAVAMTVGLVMLAYPRTLPVWVLHGVIGLGSLLICLCIYFASAVVAIFPSMFIWVVLMTAYFFNGREAMAHLGWLLLVYGLALAVTPAHSGISGVTRWVVTAFVLAIAALITSWLVSGLRRQIAAREALESELRHLALHDPLTGLANRRLAEEELSRELARSSRDASTLCVAIIDVDGFKRYNDTNGHAAGDRLLKASAGAWRRVLRAGDLISRFGGDEFVIVLPACPVGEAQDVIERLRASSPDGTTCSAGIAVAGPSDTVDSLLMRADAALYEAKRGGRNSLVVG